jgi:hypothetical protein
MTALSFTPFAAQDFEASPMPHLASPYGREAGFGSPAKLRPELKEIVSQR